MPDKFYFQEMPALDKTKLRDLVKGELIGCFVRVPEKRIEGRIINETKNLLVVETADKKRKKLIKGNNVFEIMLNNEFIKVDGKILAVRPEDRIKIHIK